MILSLLSLLNVYATSHVDIPTPIVESKKHASPQKILIRNYSRNFKSREILKKETKKPWNGHFSANNFRANTADDSYLSEIKENLKTSITSLPKWHTEALENLEVKNKENISRGLASSSKIVLHTSSIQNSEELMAVFIHEMGHITDLGAIKGERGRRTSFYDGKTPILSDDISLQFYRISWQNSYNKKKQSRRNDFVSGYAMSDVFEDFAETYLFYRLHGDKFRGILGQSNALQKKYEFMKKHVFENQEFQLEKINDERFSYQTIFDTTLLSFNPQSL